MSRTMMLALAAAALLGACASNDAAPVGAIPGASLSAADPVVVERPKDLAILPDDVIKIDIDEDSTLGKEVQIPASGQISMRLIGDVKATGMTTTQLAADLARRYEKYIKDPHVLVQMRPRVSNEVFTVDGAVRQPGVYPLSGSMSLIKAVALAKGTEDLANTKQVVVFRTINQQRVAGVISLDDVRSGKVPDPKIYANDTVVVPQSNARRTLKDIVGVVPLVGLAAFLP